MTQYVTFPAESRRPPRGEELEEEEIFKRVKERRMEIKRKEKEGGEGNKGWFGWGR